jgi:hypothetical protein
MLFFTEDIAATQSSPSEALFWTCAGEGRAGGRPLRRQGWGGRKIRLLHDTATAVFIQRRVAGDESQVGSLDPILKWGHQMRIKNDSK